MNRTVHIYFPFLFILLFVTACTQDQIPTEYEFLDVELQQKLEDAAPGLGKSAFVLPAASNFSAIPQDPKNPITADKVGLGKLLYHETGMAINPINPRSVYTYSCASCHHVAAGFQAGRMQGIGEGGLGFGDFGEGRDKDPMYDPDSLDVQPIRTPSALNVAYQKLMLWNGQFGATGANIGTEAQWTEGTPKAVNRLGYEGVEIQAIAGMGVHRLGLDDKWVVDMDYKEMFDKVFASVPEDQRYDAEYAGLAIAAYERTLLPNQAPFQKWLKGDRAAMNEQEKRGAILFFGKANCVSCHTGPALNSMEFYALGMPDLDGPGIYGPGGDDMGARKGRGGFTGKQEDEYKFKVPQLYNLREAGPLGHGGNFYTVEEVIRYKNMGIPQQTDVPTENLAEEF
ncbi:MAG: cytochrome c peroxidase, partial [Bacteroidota bacterium]